jgi:hypothetical protein
MSNKNKDFMLMSATTVVGMVLVFVLLTVKENPIVSTVVGISAGLVLLVFGMTVAKSSLHRHRRIVDFTDSVTIYPGTHLDIIFAPPVSLKNPKLSLASKNTKVEVDEVWHNGVGTLMGRPKPLYYWHTGQYYPGLVDYHSAIIIRVSNNTSKPAVVTARLVGYAEKA